MIKTRRQLFIILIIIFNTTSYLRLFVSAIDSLPLNTSLQGCIRAPPQRPSPVTRTVLEFASTLCDGVLARCLCSPSQHPARLIDVGP
ncbi:hypothetical protein IWX91DRAFT_341994 [Phyllosticta citricarpa]